MTEKSAIRILVIDDDPFMLKLLNRMLGNLGFTGVATCGDGCAALEWLDSPDHRPDLILLDLNMPEMDGAEFVRKLVERRYGGSLILVSGEDERVLQTAENLVHAHRIALLGSLRKPVGPERLAALLGKWSPPTQFHPPPTKRKDYGADEVRAAIANGELVNYYQPKVAVATGRVVGMEALARWLHPEDGLLLPRQFIGVAEQHSLIGDLTRTVLTNALAQARLWQEAGLVLQMAVNVSACNLDSPDFADLCSSLAAAADVPPQEVVLEMVEDHILMHDLRIQLEALTRLRLKRFRMSIDDFGTGYSSLTHLRDTPFDELKIDGSLVHGVSSDGIKRAKYEACLSIARQLNMDSIAEGVEDRADWEFLRETGCDFAQGNFIARPMPATSIPDWIQSWQTRLHNDFGASERRSLP